MKKILTDLAHAQEFPLEWEKLCSSLELQESAYQHHPFPSAEDSNGKLAKCGESIHLTKNTLIADDKI